MVDNDAEFELEDIIATGVVGLGSMGSGIAYHTTVQNFPVTALEVNDDALAAGRARVEKLFDKLGSKKSQDYPPARIAELKGSITYTTDYADLGPQEDEFDTPALIVEAVVENLDIKRQVFGKLDRVAHPDAILASNTSSLPITELAKATSRPDKVIGMHFFNPVYAMKLVEIVMGEETSEETLEKVRDYSTRLGKETVVVLKDRPGFLVNRMLGVYMNECMRALVEGKASAWEIDEILGPEGFGFPMGPNALGDYVGLDVAGYVSDILADAYGERMAPHPFLAEFRKLGHFGEKTGFSQDSGQWVADTKGDGLGIYVHTKTRTADNRLPLNPELEKILAGYVADPQSDGPAASMERFIYPVINEAFWCLQDGMATPGDIDKSMKIGIAFRLLADRKGPLELANDIGIRKVYDTLKGWSDQYGVRYGPCDLLREYAEQGREVSYTT